MTLMPIRYTDLSGNPDAPAPENCSPEIRNALLALGFTSSGLMGVKSLTKIDEKTLGQILAQPDAAFLAQGSERGEVDELFSSPGEIAFAMVDYFFGKEYVISFLTITTDGTIIETTTKPTYRPGESEKIKLAPKTTLKNLHSQIKNGLYRIQIGTPHVWAREDRPKAGYHVELVETNQPRVLWEVHQRRLQKIVRNAQSLPPHQTLKQYLCIKARFWQINEHITNWWRRLATLGLILFIVINAALLGYVVLLDWMYVKYVRYFANFATCVSLLCILGLWPFLIAFWSLMLGFIRAYLRPEIPGPKLVSFSALEKEVEKYLAEMEKLKAS
jgi:hypothetical protein